MKLFSPQITSNREMIDQGNVNVVIENELKFGNGTNQMDTETLPMWFDPSGMNQMDSGTIPSSRKRSRDLCSFDPSVFAFPSGQFVDQNQPDDIKRMFTFLGDDISMQIRQQEAEIDRFISQHTEKMRSEIEASRRRISMRVVAVTEEGVKRLRSKEEEIVHIGRLNCALEQKVKSLSVDNQIWQQMAQTNEATANVLRCNLQQILTQIQQQQQQEQYHLAGGAMADDVESCCGSNYNYNDNEEENHEYQKRMLAKVDNRNDGEAYWTTGSEDKNGRRSRWRCRNCGKEEMCVLLLPCRHLCICTVCESSINVCPICKSTKNASVHVNMNAF